MGKIGFVQYFCNDEDDKKNNDGKQPAAKASQAESEDGLFFKRLITGNYATHGERRRLILRSSREIAYSLRNTYPVTELEVTKYMTALGFETATTKASTFFKVKQ